MSAPRGAVARHASAAVVAALLGALSLGVPLVNAGSGPPRALFVRLPADLPEPTVALSTRQAPDGHWLLDIATTGFRFTSLCLANADALPVGHAHVIAGDAKLASAYAPVVDLGVLAPGPHRFRVVLRAQDHRVLVGRAGMIEADLTIAVPDGPGQA